MRTQAGGWFLARCGDIEALVRGLQNFHFFHRIATRRRRFSVLFPSLTPLSKVTRTCENAI
ncbi:hypothetical protein SAMN05445504_5536 [Burkholderia sp. CF099]|jgi:hypothetical protein|nr:hypothetical protein SAMN05445504_5536 [Burkholderia sp. CF099]